MIPLWKGKNPIYFGVITIIPFDNLYRRAYFVMHTFLVQLSHGENKLHSMKWWWGPLCTGPACLIGSLYNVVLSSLNQQFVGSEPTSLNSLKLCASFTSISFLTRGCRGCDHMVVGFTITYIICMQSVPITTKVVSWNHIHQSWQGLLDITCDKVCQWFVTGPWFSPFSSTNKTDRQDITEMLLRVALNTINPTNHLQTEQWCLRRRCKCETHNRLTDALTTDAK
jgi:hypothetical protein